MLYLFVAIDRTSKYTFIHLHEKATRRVRMRPGQHRPPADQAEASLANGQVERMNRMLKDATVKRFYCGTPRPVAATPEPIRCRVQLCPQTQDLKRPHTL